MEWQTALPFQKMPDMIAFAEMLHYRIDGKKCRLQLLFVMM